MRARTAIGALVLASAVSLSAAQAPSPTSKQAAIGTKDVYLTLTDVNKADVYGMTPLHRAVEAGDLSAIERLIHAGAKVNAVNRYHVAPLSIAAIRGDPAAIQMLLRAGADANVLMGEGEPVLMTAVRSGNVEAIKALMAAGADVNARERLYGQTPVMWAAIDNHSDVIKALAEHGADFNARANVLEGEPMWRYRNPNDTRTGVNGEALQNFNSNFTKGGLTPLLYAARQGSTEAVLTLLNLGANPSLPNPEGFTPLLTAIMTAHYDTAAALIEKGIQALAWRPGQFRAARRWKKRQAPIRRG